jgi:hypothetical protein
MCGAYVYSCHPTKHVCLQCMPVSLFWVSFLTHNVLLPGHCTSLSVPAALHKTCNHSNQLNSLIVCHCCPAPPMQEVLLHPRVLPPHDPPPPVVLPFNPREVLQGSMAGLGLEPAQLYTAIAQVSQATCALFLVVHLSLNYDESCRNLLGTPCPLPAP